MALTSRIGTSGSQYGNIFYGQSVIIGPQTYNLSLTLAAISGFVGESDAALLRLSVVSSFGVSSTGTFLRSDSNTITFIQTATHVLVKFASAQNILIFSQGAALPSFENLGASLSIAQSATHQREINQSITQSLDMVSDVLMNRTVICIAENELLFKETFFKVTPFPGLIIPVPTAIVTVVSRRKCNVTLQSPFGVIVLPCPRLDDKFINSGLELKIKYSIDGQPYTYVRRTDLQKLSYTFWLERKKSLELRAFLINYDQNNDPITLTNWKGELWIVNIVNSPIAFTGKSRWAPCNDRTDVTLELEGIKIAG